MATYVLVHGGWCGGWIFRDVARRLQQAGHDVYTPTLTGLGERSHLLTGTVNLDTHIEDICNVIRWEALEGVVLCGHSYGGMVITGVADAMPERIGALVYADAYVPADGDSCWSLATADYHRVFDDGAAESGYACAPPPRLPARATPHPLASLRQRIRLRGDWQKVGRRVFILAEGWSGSPFPPFFEACQRHPAWTTHILSCGHNIMAEMPDEFVRLLLSVVPAGAKSA